MIKKFFVIVLLLLPLLLLCQENTDLQWRLVPSVSYKFTKKWEAVATYRYDLHKDLQEFKSSMVQGEIRYSISKKFRLETGYRFRTSHTEDQHRIFGSLRYDQEIIDGLKIFLATKYQFLTGSFDKEYMAVYNRPNHVLREDLSFEYTIPETKLSVSVGTEFFIKQDNTTKEWEISTNIGYNTYFGYSEGFNDPNWIWNASVAKSIRGITLKLMADDILNQHKMRSRSAGDNYYEDYYKLSLGRKIMLSVTFNFGKSNAARSQAARQSMWDLAW